MALLLVLVALIAAQVTRTAWRETCLREAYLPDLQSMVEHDPYNGRLLALLGVRLCQAKQFGTASPYFEHAIAAGENNSTMWLTWSATAAASGDRAHSWSILQYAKKHQPDLKPELQAALDRCRMLPANASLEALSMAISPHALQPALDRYGSGSFFNGLALWYGRRHLEQSGFMTRERLAREQPQNAQIQQLWGEALLRNERVVEAVPVLKHALSLAPDSLTTRLDFADALYEGGAGGKAALEYIACLKARPNWLPALLGLGRVTIDKKLIGMGVQIYERAVKQDPKSADAWLGLGRAYMNQRLNLSRALLGFQTAAQLAPTRTDFYGEYSDALRVNYRAAEAETILRKRLTIAPDEARTHYLLATTLLTNNPTSERLQEAELELRSSLRLEPAGYAAAAELGKLLVQQGRAAEAVPLLETALKADPRDVAALAALARAYKKVGRAKDAAAAAVVLAKLSQYVNRLNMLEEQLQRQPKSARLYHELAVQYARGGETDKADVYETEALALERNTAQASQTLSTLREATSNTIPLQDRPAAKTP